MEHEILAHQTGRVRKAVGEQPGPGVQKQAGCPDAVAADNNDAGQLLMGGPFLVVVDDTSGSSFAVQGDLPNPGPGFQDGSPLDRPRPVGDVRTGFGSRRTSQHAATLQCTAWTTLVSFGNDGVVRDPPTPAQLIERSSNGLSQQTDGKRWSRAGSAWRVAGIPSQPGDAHLSIVGLVVGLQIPVCDGPVVGYSVQ